MTRRDRFSGQFPAVLAAARAGDQAALGRIFTTLAPVVEGYLRLQGASEPEDLTSEVFVGVLRNLDSFEGGEPGFRSWVFTIAHRRLLDDRRRRGRQPTYEPLDAAGDPAADDDIEAVVGAALGRARVEELCRCISPGQRDVLLLRLLGGFTVEEVAAMLGRTPGGVKALQRRGFTAISRLLAREEALR